MGLSVEADQMFKDGLTDTVTYTAYGQSGVSISAIWAGSRLEGPDQGDGLMRVYRGSIYCSTDDVTSPSDQDTFTIGGVTWQVDDIDALEDFNSTVVELRLVRYVRKEISGPDHRIRRS